MLIVFRTAASADITMFGDAAVALLKLMGQTGEVPGGLLAADVPAALDRLRARVAGAPQDDPHATTPPEPGDVLPVPVTLRSRAVPLIQLLEAAARKQRDVIWEALASPVRR